MKRLVLTVIVTATAWGAYRLYAQFLGPLIAVEVPPAAQIAAVLPPAERKDVHPVAVQLPVPLWGRPKFTVKHGEDMTLCFDDYAPREEWVDVHPFALIWNDPRRTHEDPYVFVCDSARVKFERPFTEFKPDGPSPGRLTDGELVGNVLITGPDGLRINGSNCTFREATHQIYSDDHLTFAWKPEKQRVSLVEGEAYQLQIDLTPCATAELGRDMPHVSGIESIRLRRNVRVDFTYEEESRLQTARVTSSGEFRYDVKSNVCSFDDQVKVLRPTNGPGQPAQLDRLLCRWMALQFEDPSRILPTAAAAVTPVVEKPEEGSGVSPLGHLRFRLLRATGDEKQPVVFDSQKMSIRGRMMDLGYDALRRGLVLMDSQSPGGVELVHEGAKLHSPIVQVAHDEAGEVTLVECLQPGRLDYAVPDEKGGPPQPVTVRWKTRLRYEPHPDETYIELIGDASVIQPKVYGILSDKLSLWAVPQGADPLRDLRKSPRDERILAIPGTDTGATNVAAPPPPFPLRRALAEGNVAMAGQRMQVETTRLNVIFAPGTLPEVVGQQSGNPPGSARGEGGEQQPASDRDLNQQSWIVKANSVEAKVLFDPRDQRQVDVHELIGEGKVTIRQQPPPDAPPGPLFSVDSDRLHLLNEGGVDQTLHLTGEPAHLRRGELHIEGNELLFDRQMNTAKVIGRGMMQVPVNGGLSGLPVDKSRLDLQWKREMVFDGLRAKFIEGVLGRMEDSVIRCDMMTVSLNRRIDFSSDRPQTGDAAVRKVHCLNGVDIELNSWGEDGQELTGITKGHTAEFELNNESGDFIARGGGQFNGWQKGTGMRVAIEPDTQARANQAAETPQSEWTYTRVDFADRITGNIHKRTGTLHDRVKVLYAPVERPLQVFLRDDLSKETPNARRAVFLGCDELQISLHPWSDRLAHEHDYVQLLALGRSRVELEGHVFQGSADTLSYDESTKLFTLRGLGANKAWVSYQEGIASQYQQFDGQTIQFNPSTRRASVENSGGAYGAK